ncbi:hypothetical protein [Burkholderia phage vB_BpP_HN02]|uniref:Uncharacterized protein n=1 Tax=Burkholderia phage vB_BpP_HN02 TaxID=3116925 RepID=A0AAX4JGY6_9CAUD
MGLIVNTTAPGDIPVNGAYVRVEEVRLAGSINTFSIRKYVRVGAPNAFASEMYSIKYDIEGANPFRQAYDYLRTLPEYKDSVDDPDPIDPVV